MLEGQGIAIIGTGSGALHALDLSTMQCLPVKQDNGVPLLGQLDPGKAVYHFI